mmetsp:Transcript_18198/g.47454  ORF Transcript_18198/g.47454 Transcript_18198/m.47454 type:complete len:228 (-) Transcript_18198:1166-1849(-)
MVVADLVLCGSAVAALSQFVTVEQLVNPDVIATPRFGGLVAALSLVYLGHAYIWNFPDTFVKRCTALPLSLLGSTPVQVFSKIEIIGKVQQLVTVVAVWGVGNATSAVAAAATGTAGVGLWYGLGFIAIGQLLNVATYAAIGDAGVYYGFKLGEKIPWCYGFPFNTGLRHPQYVGVVLTTWGIAMAFAGDPTFVATGLLHAAAVVFPFFYIAMSWMEQAGDNDKKTK